MLCILLRGKHELCDRIGHGWFGLLNPDPDAGQCIDKMRQYALHAIANQAQAHCWLLGRDMNRGSASR
jgi:hypothetical protein